MLEAARAARANGIDVVIGYVEPHGRVETERLMDGLEQVPTLAVRYRDIVRQEFNLDAALARHPAILIVDELAHSNLSGGEPAPRHPEALAGHRGVAGGRHRCLDHGQRPASREPQRRGRADHRSQTARDAAGPDLRRGARSRADRSAAGRSAGAAARRQDLSCRRTPAPRPIASSAGRTCWRCASWRCGA